MKQIKKLKTLRESKEQEETVGEKLFEFRQKINEIIDYINSKEQIDEYKKSVEDRLHELNSQSELD